MALFHAGVQCELREVLLKDKPQAMLDISPKGTVPVLQLSNGRVIDESLDIMRWALAGDEWLAVNDAEVFALIASNDNSFKHHLDRYKYPQRFESGGQVDHFQAAGAFLAQLDERLVQSNFLFGDVIGLADVAIFPFVRQFAAVDQQAFAALRCVDVQQWLLRCLSYKSFQATMLKHMPWHPGDEPIFLGMP